MALDEVFLTQASQKMTLPTLRLYAWDVPTLSLGYAQKIADVNLPALKIQGWDLVRRPTGGKAILHTDELTYSISAPVDDPVVTGTLLESYQRISSALQEALEYLGVKTTADKEYANSPENSRLNPVCFEVPSSFEITHHGKKIIGSAQARKSGGVLQHGSLPLFGDLGRITKVLQYDGEGNRKAAEHQLAIHSTTLAAAAGRTIDWKTAAQAFIKAFSTKLDIVFEYSDPGEKELALAAELMQSKYAAQAWNHRF